MKENQSIKNNIAIDALGINHVGGARSVTLPLLKRVFKMKKEWRFFCFLTQFEEDFNFPNVKQIVLPLSKGPFSRLLFQLVFPILVIVYKIDITHFIKSQASLIFFSKKVLTIYDCTILKYPQYFNLLSRLFWRHLQPIVCRNMDRIITISENAKSEIIEFLNVPPEKISVIYPAPQFDSRDANPDQAKKTIRQKYTLGEEYILYIGQIGLKKNLNTLIKAYKIIKEKRPDAPPLILVGPRYHLSDAGEIFDMIDRFNLNECIHYLGPVEKHQLYEILSKALFLLFPSVHEGFGIPLVEAMQQGIPVIASNTSVMPEVLNNAGVLVNEFLSPSAWADKIIQLYDDPELRNQLSIQGSNRAKNFSWKTSAEKLIHIYEELL